MSSRLTYAIACILAGASGSATAAAAAAGADSSSSTSAGTESLGEVVVTAQRRSENIQDVPISIQAFTEQTLKQLNISTFDDYIKFLPNVTSASNGPGQNEVFMRGLSAGSQASQASAITAVLPNVAIYLDNQSGQMPNRNLDIYAADLNRIEVLEGPQGTLFGAGAQAGVIRYITNEPKLDKTEGYVKAGYGVTAGGDPNTDMQAVINLPLISEHMAVRAVVYSDRRGGYINNVPDTFARKNTDIGIHYANYPAVNGQCPDGQPNNGYCVPPGSPTLSNNALVGRAINPVTYQGTRVELLYKFNDDWDILLSQSYQNMEADGVFFQQPLSSSGSPLKPLEVTLFNPAYDQDKFESTAWTVDGKIGPLKLVYTGGYLDRQVNQTSDYTNYVRGVYADYYQCYGPGSGGDPNLPSKCFSANAFWREQERNLHQQHEFRLSTPDDWRIRGIAGAYWEDNKLYDVTSWLYKGLPACTATANVGCITDVGTLPGTTVQYPGTQTDDTTFFQDAHRETKQTAFFISGDFDIIPKVLTFTAGTRYFKFDNKFVGSVSESFGCFQGGAAPCNNYPGYAFNLDAQGLRDSESGVKSRANLTWHVTPDVMVYYTFSQGFRPGGFNGNSPTSHVPGPDGVEQYYIPRTYSSDKLTNNEIGWKTEFFDHHLQWNGAVYRENWDNVQIEFFDPGLIGNLYVNTNGQNFLIKGIETSLIGRVTDGLTLQGSASWNQSRQTNSPALIDNNPLSVNYGKAITENCITTPCQPVGDPFGPVGSPSANAPPIQFSLRARYDWTMGSYSPFVQASAHHTGHSFTQAGSNPMFVIGNQINTSRGRFEVPAYSTFDASGGVTKDAWTVMIYGQNLANSNASTFISTDQFIIAQTPLRPRVIGASFSYSF
ncbi:MAG TPA: TonB-dependent receptor [Steroidobacteraceae bacterium]|jgi:outer membrane receptor protein involved in Fe transport|nr:TonB-dependent receptor [Steroidobacteraceae bacterium]